MVSHPSNSKYVRDNRIRYPWCLIVLPNRSSSSQEARRATSPLIGAVGLGSSSQYPPLQRMWRNPCHSIRVPESVAISSVSQLHGWGERCQDEVCLLHCAALAIFITTMQTLHERRICNCEESPVQKIWVPVRSQYQGIQAQCAEGLDVLRCFRYRGFCWQPLVILKQALL